jgi:DNA mismatch repair protein MSH2
MTVKDYMLDLWCQLGADQCNFGQFTLTTLELTRYVCMDAAGIRALSLLSPPESGTANHHQSLLGHIDHCRTSQGHRKTKRRITGHAVDLVLYLGWVTGLSYRREDCLD